MDRHRDPRTSTAFPRTSPCRAVLVPVLALVFLPAPALALQYTDASPTGAAFPSWDGGDTGLRFADVNADGNVDFVTIGDHGSPYINTNEHGIMVYFGDGAGGWSIAMTGDLGYGGVAVGDVNGDGFLDVGYGMHHNYSSTDLGDQLIEVALGDGTGAAWTPWDDGLATNGETYGMFATDFADVDDDGDLDLACNSFGASNGVHVYRNNGDGTWTQTYALTGGNAGPRLCFGDVNGDGHPDIAATYQYGTIFLGDGAGGFAVADSGLPAAGTLGRAGVALGDVDGDGAADLSFVQGGGVFVYAWRTDHWVSVSAGLPATGGYDLTVLADMDADGNVDVGALGGGLFRVWLGDGAGNWSVGGSFNTGVTATGTAALEAGGDLDHNGLPDVVFVQEQGSFPSYLNHLHVIRETSVPSQRSAAVTFPHGDETLLAGSVQTIRWTAAHVGTQAATIDLDLSLSGPGGPWTSIGAGLPDGGARQWTVPAVASAQAHVRATLTQAGQSVQAVSAAFRIEGPTATVAQSVAAGGGVRARLRVLGNPVRDLARFRVEGTGPVGSRITIYDVLGRVVRVIPVGAPAATWDLEDASGSPVPSGVYLAVLRGSGRDAARERIAVVR